MSIVPKDVGKNRLTTNDHLNDDGQGFVKRLQVVTTGQNISLDFIAIFKVDEYQHLRLRISIFPPCLRTRILTSVLFGLDVDQKNSIIIGIWPKSTK